MQRLTTEMQRLQRLGRFDEAQALGRRVDELMSKGPMGRTFGETMGRSADVLRQLPPGTLPEGVKPEDLQEATRFSIGDMIGMERGLMEGEGAYLPEALFVRPMQLYYLPETMGAAARMPMAARNHLFEAYRLMAAKDYAGADASLKQAAALSRSPQVVEAMGRLESARGNSQAALRLLDEAINSADDPKSPLVASFLWQQASIHSALGAHRRAADLAERALALIGRSPDGAAQATGQNNIGVALHLGGDAAGALKHYERALSALQAAMAKASPQTGPMLQMQLPTVAANRGLAFWQLGDLRRAAESFRVALDERAYFEGANDAFMTERAQLAKAQAVTVELHALMSLDPNVLGLQTLLERKGALLERRTRVQTAFRRDANVQTEQPGFVGRLFESPMARAERERAGRQRAEDQDLLREYEAAVQERAALQRTPANAQRIADLDTRIQVMQQRMQMHEAQTRNQDQQLSQAEFTAIARQSGNDPLKVTAAIEARTQQQQQAREQSAKDARASLFSRVQARVPQGAVLLEMVKYRPLDPRPGLAEEKRWAAERYGAYVIRPAGEAQYVDLGVAGPLDKLIGEFRAALANPERLGARDLGRKLDDALMRPVRARLGDARTLYVAPEGALNLIPLGALVDEKGAYLLERYTINYLASGRDLLHLGRNEPARGPAIIIADPAFDQTPSSAQPSEGAQRRSRDFRSTKYKRLPGTAAEAQTLKRVLPDAAVLTGTAATETAAKRIAGPRILHIATHGFFLEDVPGESEDPMLRSGLVFAGVNALSSAEDDGVLTALEASNLDLRGTKLVVLSACETGLGEVKNGEGVFGLRRAFVVAGAETLLMSLWQVADDATKDLMVSYYARLARGEPRGEALRNAQLAMLKDAKTAHPFFWAAFISSGESQPLK
jgi:CHAT domain-containing protein/tetratricopeptide (TPR) repeat protein